MKGKERGRKKVKETKRKTLGGVVEKEGRLRGTALSVQFKNKKQKKLELHDVSNV